MSEILVLTGGTGWVGRNFISEIQKRLSIAEFQERVLIFGSKKGSIILNDFVAEESVKIPIYPLSSLNNMLKKKPRIHLIHSAFLRKEKIQKLGLKKYIQTNIEITNCVSELLRSSNDSKTVAISSGAATQFEKNKNSTEDDPYGYLKLNEENKLAEVSECMKLRIYGLTGKFINNPELFALGSFLYSAIQKKEIEIKSKCPVIRSYGFASDIARFGLSWLNSNDGSDSFYAATETITLNELANKITKMFNLKSVKHQIDFELPANEYICDTDNFRQKLSKYKLQITPMGDQILETYKYLLHKY